MILPVGAGIGATHPAWAVMSSLRAAGRPQKNTDDEPMATSPGPLGTHDGSMHGVDMLPTTAACLLLIMIVGMQMLTMVHGWGGWATGVGTGAAGWMGA